MSGRKDDGEKPPMQLIDAAASLELARVLGFGAKKYAPDNWRSGIALTRILGAIKRHTAAIEMGEDRDPETGLLHAAHLMCEAMFLVNFQLYPDKYAKFDDRYGGQATSE